ncbi:hypothetical protein [Xanthomonas nasturtii]|uniref:hypothetical protein n=1 Tax=Xanthomonas nasturtii TaxID=1843581 RepID=UPI0020110F3A|nr:hypothetical protein [Xanthomonas nasturtii]
MTSPTPVIAGADARWIGATRRHPASFFSTHASFRATFARGDAACTKLVQW